ncbi:MAG: hypothetical protein AAF220_03885, partial [Pseudomonadota bacterium]
PWAITSERKIKVFDERIIFDLKILLRFWDYYGGHFDKAFFQKIFTDLLEVCNGKLSENIKIGRELLDMKNADEISFTINFAESNEIRGIDSILFLIEYNNDQCVGPKEISGSSVFVFENSNE